MHSDKIRGVIRHLNLAYLAEKKKWAEMVSLLQILYAECMKHFQLSPGHVLTNGRVAALPFLCLFGHAAARLVNT